GFDIGGVIIDRVNNDTDTSFSGDRYLETTAVPGALETLKELCAIPAFANCIHFVSKCNANTERKTREWLNHRHILTGTGLVEAKHFHFCRKREQKAEICKQLGITHFFDDRLEISGKILKDVVPHRFIVNPVRE